MAPFSPLNTREEWDPPMADLQHTHILRIVDGSHRWAGGKIGETNMESIDRESSRAHRDGQTQERSRTGDRVTRRWWLKHLKPWVHR